MANIKFELLTKVSDSQFQEILDLVVERYAKDNSFWKRLEVSKTESRQFFEAYQGNCDVMTIVFDTNKNNKIIGGLMGNEIVNNDYSAFLNWINTPRMEPYIDMLKHIFNKADLTKIPKGRKFFGKCLFADAEYPRLGNKILLTHYKNIYKGGFKSHTTIISNKIIFKKGFSKLVLNNSDIALCVYDQKLFEWKNMRPFKDMQEPPKMWFGTLVLEDFFGASNDKRPKL